MTSLIALEQANFALSRKFQCLSILVVITKYTHTCERGREEERGNFTNDTDKYKRHIFRVPVTPKFELGDLQRFRTSRQNIIYT